MNPPQHVQGEEEDTALLQPSLEGWDGEGLGSGCAGGNRIVSDRPKLVSFYTQLPCRCCTALATSVCTTRVGTRLTVGTKSLP